MIRIAKFVGIFLAVTIAVFGGIYLLNKSAVDAVLKNDLSEGTEWVPKTYSLRGLVEYLAADPNSYSLVSLRGDEPDSSIYFNADAKRSLGNLAHIMLIAAYVDAVDSGTVDRNQAVDWAKIYALHVPRFENNRFSAAISELQKVENPVLDDLVRFMVKNNEAAFADYLQYILGYDVVVQIPHRFGAQNIEAPLLWSGFVLAWDPGAQQASFEELETRYSSMVDSVYHQTISDLGKRYANDLMYRDEVSQLMANGDELLFAQEKKRNAMATRGSPIELAQLLHELLNGTLLNAAAQNHLKDLLSWPMKNPKTARDFSSYAAVYDSRMGYLAGIDIGMVSGETEPTTQVFIMENIPIGLFLHLSSNLMTQDFQQRLIWDPALANLAYSLLSNTNSEDGLSQSIPPKE